MQNDSYIRLELQEAAQHPWFAAVRHHLIPNSIPNASQAEIDQEDRRAIRYLCKLIPDVNLMSVSFNFDRYFSQQAIRTTLVEKGLLPLGMEAPNIESLRIQGVYPLEFEMLYTTLRDLKEAWVNPIVFSIPIKKTNQTKQKKKATKNPWSFWTHKNKSDYEILNSQNISTVEIDTSESAKKSTKNSVLLPTGFLTRISSIMSSFMSSTSNPTLKKQTKQAHSGNPTHSDQSGLTGLQKEGSTE